MRWEEETREEQAHFSSFLSHPQAAPLFIRHTLGTPYSIHTPILVIPMASLGRLVRTLPAARSLLTRANGRVGGAKTQGLGYRHLGVVTRTPEARLSHADGQDLSFGGGARRTYSSHPASAPASKEGEEAARKKVTLTTIRKLWREKRPITMLTAYDYPTGLIVDRAGMDLCLVGDSLGMVCLGYNSTTSVTMEDMIHHCSATSRGAQKAFLIGDLPFGAYQASTEQAIRNACRLMQEGNVESIKLEGGRVYKERISAMTGAGIPVMGHIGLTPQSQAALGGYRVQGKTASQVGVVEGPATPLPHLMHLPL